MIIFYFTWMKKKMLVASPAHPTLSLEGAKALNDGNGALSGDWLPFVRELLKWNTSVRCSCSIIHRLTSRKVIWNLFTSERGFVEGCDDLSEINAHFFPPGLCFCPFLLNARLSRNLEPQPLEYRSIAFRRRSNSDPFKQADNPGKWLVRH